MSRHFELLQQTEKDHEVFVMSGTRPAPTNPGGFVSQDLGVCRRWISLYVESTT